MAVKAMLRAVAASELEEFLAKLDLLDSIRSGKIKCAVCGRVISLDNLHCVCPDGDEIRVACDALQCSAIAARSPHGGNT